MTRQSGRQALRKGARRASRRPLDPFRRREDTQGRDRFFEGLRAGGSLVTVRGSTHMSFTDGPSYLTSLGRRIAGGATVGSRTAGCAHPFPALERPRGCCCL